jgi:hypothetical protein
MGFSCGALIVFRPFAISPAARALCEERCTVARAHLFHTVYTTHSNEETHPSTPPAQSLAAHFSHRTFKAENALPFLPPFSSSFVKNFDPP